MMADEIFADYGSKAARLRRREGRAIFAVPKSIVTVHAPESSAANSPVKSSAPAGPARNVLPVHDEPDRGRKPVLRDELAAVVTQRQYPRERLQSIFVLALVGFLGCASIPKRQYGVEKIEWVGVEQMDSEAIASCLATRERESVTLRLSLSSPECGSPPFDSSPPSLALWTFPWTDWPVYDPAIVEVDRERIQRWYEARGYYGSSIKQIRAYLGDQPVDSPECPEGNDCELRLVVQIEEGQPVIVERVKLAFDSPLSAELTDQLQSQIELKAGQRFDEAVYRADKDRLTSLLRNASYARAKIAGKVLIDRGLRSARVEYRVEPGLEFVFGEVSVNEMEGIPTSLVIQAADITKGAPYSEDLLDDAQRAVFALGVFSSVKLVKHYAAQGGVVDITILARLGRLERPSAGFGVMSGILRRTTSDEVINVPEWDLHLRFAYEHRNFLGGLRKLRIEERPRLIMLDDFPKVPSEGPVLGNLISLSLEQPATFEARTVSFSENEWDFGPDAFYGFFRHDLALKLGLRRSFFMQRLQAQVAIQHDLYEIVDDMVPDTVSSYRLPFVEQLLRLDLRDDSRRPSSGLYAAITIQEALRLGGYGSWNYVRIIPDLRGYVPVFWDLVLAARFSIGALFVLDSADLDPTSKALGPQSYRLRGGGAYSNRGFSAGELGDGIDGGIRRWEGSLELRVPLGGDFGVTLFGDVGDVSRGTAIRFSHLNTATGLGLRYYSIIGAIRLDAAWRIPGLQRAGVEQEPIKISVEPSAMHLTIGESF
jgi:outer membrane protein assembly factor BamA